MLSVVSELCGLHAQVMSSAELMLWARVDGLRRDALGTALWRDRTLVKMWAMRGTLHVFRASEHALWQAALSTYAHFPSRAWARYFGITMPEMERLIATVGEVLDGRVLTREELAEEIAQRHRSRKFDAALRESWGGFLKPASYQGLLCFGPSDGQRVRFANPRAWLGIEESRADPQEALVTVIRHFLAANGPASNGEIARWWGRMSPTAVGKLVGSLDDVVAFDVQGTPGWALARHADAIADAGPARSVRLLPTFDQYVIGATSHSRELMPGAFRERVHRQAGWVSPVLLVDGRIEGVWSHARKDKRLAVGIEPFRKQPVWVRKGAEAEAERLAAFLGSSLDLTWVS
jgi:Winged helix DNA-binding domain